MTVPFYNFHELHNESFREQVKSRIGKIIDNNAFVEGEYNQKFESEFANLQGAKHCLLVANGTDALEISLLAYGVQPGDKVGVPGITFYATAEAVLNVGATPVMIDIESKSGLMCPKSLESISKNTKLKAIIPVHIYGLPAPIKKLESVCLARDIKIIEDAAQAQGTLLGTQPVGSSNNLVTFSFYPTKNLSAFGDAGCILTQSDELAEKIKVIRNHGRGDDNKLGRNSRCDHIQAAVLHLKLEKVEQYNTMRKEIAQNYHNELNDSGVELLDESFLAQSSWHLYPVQLDSVKKREDLQARLSGLGIGCAPFYEKTLSQEKPLADFPGEDKNALAFAGRTLCLPMNPFLSKEDVQTVAKAIKEFLK